MYYISDRYQRLFVRQFKVAGTSTDWLINFGCNKHVLKPDPILLHYLSYEWFTICREPMERLRSYWTANMPRKPEGMTFRQVVEGLLGGTFNNPHITPQIWLVEPFKRPDVIIKIEELEEKRHLIEGMFHPSRVYAEGKYNVSPVRMSWQELFDQKACNDLIPETLDYYDPDYRYWDYARPAA